MLGYGSIDVRKVESLQEAVERCVKHLGGIDFVIAGAAGNFLAPISQLSTNAFKSVMDIDVLGSYNTVKATMPHLIQSAAKHKAAGNSRPSVGTGGRIIFISATMHYTGVPLQAHVGVAKAGVDALSSSIAIELGPRGVTSNVIAPGGIMETEGLGRLSRKEDLDKLGARVPSGRFGSVKEIADATVYLFSDAGNYVNGDVLVGKSSIVLQRPASTDGHASIVDGGAWRTHGADPGSGFQYPDFLLSDEVVTGVKGGKKSKL